MIAALVREAVAADAGTIAALAHALSLEEGYPAPALQARHVRAEGFRRPSALSGLIAERDGRPVGYALFYPAYDTDHAVRRCCLRDPCVKPGSRRQGAGRTLMAAVAQTCEADRGCYVCWNAQPGNRAGLGFYRPIGRARSRQSRSPCSRTR